MIIDRAREKRMKILIQQYNIKGEIESYKVEDIICNECGKPLTYYYNGYVLEIVACEYCENRSIENEK